jgi:hypothetical protein
VAVVTNIYKFELLLAIVAFPSGSLLRFHVGLCLGQKKVSVVARQRSFSRMRSRVGSGLAGGAG